LLLVVGVCQAGMPLVAEHAVVDSEGRSRQVRFAGDVDGTTVRGTVTVKEVVLEVRGEIAPGGGLSGTLTHPDGARFGSFRAEVASPDRLRVTYQVGTQTGTMIVPVDEAEATRLLR
jgi:hypothetical protein